MPNDLTFLANAFNTAVQKDDTDAHSVGTEDADTRARLREQRLRDAARIQQAKDTLFGALVTFAEQVDALRIERTDAGVVFSYRDRVVSLDGRSQGPSIAVMGTGTVADRLDLDVADTWVLTLNGSLREFLPYGLQELLVRSLGLPRPAYAVSDPGPPLVRRAPRIQSSISPPRPPFKRR
ncbi:MAG: hypothetical protein ACJAZO_001143 [Myxococcota bacterium]|jgi:hypothetical protein